MLTATQEAVAAAPGDGLTSFPPDLDVTTRPVDLEQLLLAKTDAQAVVVPATTRTPAERLDAWLFDVIVTAHAALAWLYAGVADAGAASMRWGRRSRYRGRHSTKRRWYGRMRSTAEVTGVLHRQYFADRALTIPPEDVPSLHAAESLFWVGWSERMLETLQASDEALHPTNTHRFICS